MQAARGRPLSAQTVRDEWRRSGSTRIQAAGVRAEVEPGVFVPASVLKQARRDFWQWADTNVSEADLAAAPARAAARFREWRQRPLGPTAEAGKPGVTVLVPGGARNPVRGAATARLVNKMSLLRIEICIVLPLPRN